MEEFNAFCDEIQLMLIKYSVLKEVFLDLKTSTMLVSDSTKK